MKKIILTLTILSASTYSFAATNIEEAVNSLCACGAKPIESGEIAIQDTRDAQRTSDVQKLLSSQKQMGQARRALSDCSDQLLIDYPEIGQDSALKDKVRDAAWSQCRNPFGWFKE